MKWQDKARVMQICANLPKGDNLYKLLQSTFGRLNDNPLSRINMQAEMTRWIRQQDMPLKDCTVFEVGTGHKPVVPIGFFLSGVDKVITVDLNRRLDFNLLKKTLLWMVLNRQYIESIYNKFTHSTVLNQRLNLLQKLQDKPQQFLVEANIQYLAPTDAAATRLHNNSVDYHISTTVLEHIPINIIKNIFVEAKRILKNNGAVIHFIDLSDHFQHQDKSINKINFLQYSEEEWLKLAGNQFAYCNRLRASEFVHIFNDLSFKTIRSEIEVDNESIISINNSFMVNNKFSHYRVDDLCTVALKLMLSKTKSR